MTNKIIIKSLKNIAIGYMFIIFELNIGTLDIIPDFVGYIYIYQGIKSLTNTVLSLKLLVNFAILLGIISFMEWVLAIFNIGISIYIINTVITIITLYFDFHLITDIVEIGKMYNYIKISDMIFLRNAKVIIYTVIYLMAYFTGFELLISILALLLFAICLTIIYFVYLLAQHIEKQNYII